jgi:PKD repeat protein
VKSYGVHGNTGFKLKTLNVIYCMRIGFGILAALVAALVVNLKVGAPLMNGITVGLAVYLVSFYLLKWLFMNKVEKPTKILTMGVGAYALTFVFCWVLFVTPFLAPPTATFTVTPDQNVVGETITFDATASVDPDGKIVTYVWDFGDENTTKTEDNTITHSYTVAGDYTVKLKVVDDHGIGSSNTTTLTVSAAPS